MPMGRPKTDLMLDSAERAQLQSMIRSRSIPAALRARAQIVLASAGGEPNSSIAARLGYTNATIGKWRRRFVERRITRKVFQIEESVVSHIKQARRADR